MLINCEMPSGLSSLSTAAPTQPVPPAITTRSQSPNDSAATPRIERDAIDRSAAKFCRSPVGHIVDRSPGHQRRKRETGVLDSAGWDRHTAASRLRCPEPSSFKVAFFTQVHCSLRDYAFARVDRSQPAVRAKPSSRSTRGLWAARVMSGQRWVKSSGRRS